MRMGNLNSENRNVATLTQGKCRPFRHPSLSCRADQRRSPNFANRSLPTKPSRVTPARRIVASV